MLPCAEVLTPPSIPKPDYISYTALELLRSSLLLLQVDSDLDHHRIDRQVCMAQPTRERHGRATNDIELWLSSSRPEAANHEEQSTYAAYTPDAARNLVSMNETPSSDERRRYLTVSSISPQYSTNPNTDAAPSPHQPSPEWKKKRKPTSFRNVFRRRPSEQQDDASTFLNPPKQPATQGHSLSPYQYHAAGAVSTSALPIPPTSSHSMPSTPYRPYHPPAQLTRAVSAHANPSSPVQNQNMYQPFPQQTRSVSVSDAFEPTPPRTRRTFPESGQETETRPRPQTWLNPEPFEDASQFHLFVEATSGLSNDVGLGWDGGSPMSPPRLQPSLFGGAANVGWNADWNGRGRARDRTSVDRPLPPLPRDESPGSYYSAPQASQNYQAQAYLQSVSGSTLPQSQHQPQRMTAAQNAINLELERLGLEEEDRPDDDELPNYAQSQAEMNEARRTAASNRARELEERWNSSRGRRR